MKRAELLLHARRLSGAGISLGGSCERLHALRLLLLHPHRHRLLYQFGLVLLLLLLPGVRHQPDR